MKKVFWIVLLLVFVGVTAGYARTMSIARDRVNVRTKPSKRASILFQAPKGYPIVVKKKTRHWLYFEDWNGNKGWVYRPLVSAIPTTVIRVDTANVRKGPGTRRPLIAQAKQGEIYRVLGEQGDWVKIGYYYENEVVGWIYDDLVWGY
ncbi:SH3 domain-containing protein [Desulfobacca acetoxidans]|uniref:SH3 type 3 domain protein n=1 Tax=Desulfobacca acetoxidans (strain ATCC 700848 / DSM 11109 / ASRB2) TaxID=880072 RepID=F2NDE5_DESAR|nr:SH3 domain-containing protein [Desulfobacca acetoxidans]AEB10011.1 SH3 type 3 domain protein [Desulfobacca acetoxidans DSM 11109]